ncbi:unnamed protein product [Trichobilharzia regenti]|nr:unnamed protein product [Trichobilharzia regenti]
MQRCALSLNEALFRSSTISSTSDSTNTTTNPIKRTILDDLGLTPVEIIRQFILAVACLHRNHIGMFLLCYFSLYGFFKKKYVYISLGVVK